MKKLLPLVLLFLHITGLAQFMQYDASSLYDSLYARVHRIEIKLYNAATGGKIRPYKTDSLNSYFQPDELKHYVRVTTEYEEIGGKFYAVDSMKPIDFDPKTGGKGLAAYYKPTADLKSTTPSFTLMSITPMYQPVAGNTDILLPIQPMFFVKFEELKSVLTAYEVQILVQLSNLLLTDKHWGSYYNESENIKMSSDYFYSSGIWSNLKKYALLSKESLKAVADNVYHTTVQYILEDLLKHNTIYYSDPLLKTKYTLKEIERLTAVPVTFPIYLNQGDTMVKKDTTILARINEKAFNSFRLNASMIGIRMDNADQNTFYMKREDFGKRASIWMDLFLFDNF